jgi:anti-sigma regulatory factor (Ser/Thr protein kinase)
MLDLGPEESDVRLARQFLAAHCERWGCRDLLEDGRLVVSELVTNAVIHAGRRCELAIAFRGGWLRVEVRDRGPGGPEVQAAHERSEHGRGLVLVSAVTEAWGVEPLADGGKVVWAEMRAGPEPAAGGGPDRTKPARRPSGGSPSPFSPPGAGPGFCVVCRTRRPRRADRVALARRARRRRRR